MSLLKTLGTDKAIPKAGDFLGGYAPLDSGLYKMKVKLAFMSESTNGAVALNLHMETDTGQLLKQTIYVSNKKKQNFFLDKKGKKQYLPGFNQVNALTQLTLGKDLKDVGTAMKTINLYDFAQKKEVPQKVEVLMDLLKHEITCGIVNQVVDVTTFHDGTKKWVPTGKTRVENEINKMFHPDTGLTITEMDAGMTEPKFKDQWAKKWDGVVLNKTKAPKGKPVADTDTAPAMDTVKAAPKEDLFDGE